MEEETIFEDIRRSVFDDAETGISVGRHVQLLQAMGIESAAQAKGLSWREGMNTISTYIVIETLGMY